MTVIYLFICNIITFKKTKWGEMGLYVKFLYLPYLVSFQTHNFVYFHILV